MRATSREMSWRFCPRSQTSGHLDVSDNRKLAGTDLCQGTDLAMPLRKRVGVASAAEGERSARVLKSQNRSCQSHRAAATARAIDRRGGDHRAGHGRGHVHDLCRGCPDHGGGPSGDRVQHGRDLLPSNPYRTVHRRGAASPSELPRRVVESNSLRATCNALLRDTNTPPPTRTQDLACLAQPEPPEPAVVVRS